jgi:predicted amidohydrolase YtcJ
MSDQTTPPRDPDAAEKARARFAQALADLGLTAVQRMAVKAAAEDFAAQFVEAHARSPYPPRRRQQEAAS